MKKAPRLSKRERRAVAPQPTATHHTQDHHDHTHIHCVACGRHLDDNEFDEPATATVIACQHKGYFPSCVICVEETQRRLDEHDRTGKPVQTAVARH